MLGSYSIMRSDSIISDKDDSVISARHLASDVGSPKEPKEKEDNPIPTEQPTEAPPQNRAKWLPEEVEKLVSLRTQFPDMPWEELQATYFPDRTIAGIKGKIWRLEDAQAKTRKRSRSESSTGNDYGGLGDIPFEGMHGGGGGNLGINPTGKSAHTPQMSSRNPKPSPSTAKRIGSGTQARKSALNSLPTTASFSAPVNKPQPPEKKVRKSSVQLSDNYAPLPDRTDDDGENNRVQLALQLLDPKLWNHIYDEARKCESERRRAKKALGEKAALEEELKDLKSRLRKMDKNAPRAKPSTHHSPAKELDVQRVQRLKAAWSTVTSTCKDSISFNNWETAGMSEAVKVVQGEIDEMTKSVGSETPFSSPPSGMANGREHDDTRDSVMGNMRRLFDET